ncbi:amino acid ABC transporter permease [Brucella pseudogrignonensis]|jgi:polar amino acid transport system permease protein|uniref:Amino ABC transporter, permease, 3-TM region, His/Glu/Gln/Arg/opine family domain protein n=1 Tax=Brucella pseudogrignonensis TaxID=419475 RepID=A0A1A9FQ92_9HYPH|nr:MULTISPECIES: amino acid ABC transporter permease [Brucella]EMG52845.1 amino acid ABC transporter permease [Ochrobactrum sp. CDB2]MBO1025299.1 amino acid ABC transporter permease [Ochrobactrum sp. SD129]ANG97223.1 ABC transporter permease [Brucella pseudogrignonensis]MCM0752755.1 amino acid ABC transporter permease [Brucella pseudogrignonensis]MPR64440.1 amino acid ABC transporter permease [Brucella intermedia]
MAYEMDFAPVLARAPELVTGTINTIILSAEAIAIGLTIGLAVALLRFDGPRWGRKIGAVYVEAFRNTPLLVQLFLIYFGLPYTGIKLDANQAAIFAVSLNLGAYSAEIFRAGLIAIPKTQIQAGLALGLSQFQVMRYVVLVPALRIIYPALTGQLTLTLLGTSIVSAVSAKELTMAAGTIESQTFRSLETFLIVAAIYICITFFFRFIYMLFGLWLFRRRVDVGNETGALMLDVQEQKP